MATLTNFEDLVIWKDSRELCKEINKCVKQDNFRKDFALVDQINRSSGSVMDNIAEGYGRSGNKEFIQFLSIAKGSCNEVKSQVYRAADRNYLATDQAAELLSKTNTLINQIGGLMHYLKNCEYKGSKFKP
jgi:four helix bundle protein